MAYIDTIVTDMDGTLLSKKGDQVHSLNVEILHKWQMEGKKLFLATGRLDLAILPFIHQLNITEPVISCNGGLIRNFTTGEIIYKSEMKLNKVKAILAVLQSFQADYHIYTTKRVLGPTHTGKIAFFNKQNQVLPENEQVPITISSNPLNELQEGEYPLKILVVEKSLEKQLAIKNKLNSFNISVLSSGKNLIDIMNKDIDKGLALTYLAENGYLNLEKTAAFGDNENDIGMLEAAKIGIAMGNSIPETLKIASHIAEHHDIGGLGAFVKEKLYNPIENLF